MSVTEVTENSDIKQNMAALITNSRAVRAIAEAIEGTLGPQGMDCLLVDEYGSIMVTNDGVTILRAMDVNHPAARLLISAAEQQEEQVGDGTTTTTIITAALIDEGAQQILKGVPAIKVIEGIKIGIAKAIALLEEATVKIEELQSPILKEIAFIAGREHRELADLVIGAALILGGDILREDGFKLADQVIALEGVESFLLRGVLINKEPLNREMPRNIKNAKIIILDDSLEPQPIASDALATEFGLNRQLHNEQDLNDNLQKLALLGVNAIFTDRAMNDQAEALLTDLGILGVAGLARQEWQRLAKMTGARPIKKSALSKPSDELEKLIGLAAEIVMDERHEQIMVMGYQEQKIITLIVGAATKEVVGEKERIAKDTAGAVQAAWRSGVVPGGGSVELAIAERLAETPIKGMANYGYFCVINALKRPLAQICANAGLNPLEKVAEVWASQQEEFSFAWGVSCHNGVACNLTDLGIWDPYLVKFYAIKSAGEVSEAILRINTIIKMKEEVH